MFIDKWKRSALAVLTSLGPLTGCGLLPEGWSEGWDTAGFFAGADERPAMVMGTDPSAPMPVRRASIADHPAPATLPPFSGLVPPDASRPAGVQPRAAAKEVQEPIARDPKPLVVADLTERSGGLCANGSAQSPIDLRDAVSEARAAPQFHYRPAGLVLKNDGHGLQVDVPAGSWIEVEDTRYDLLQWHLHAPAEHAIGGRHAPMEVHLVHENRHGQLLVVGVMVEESLAASADNPALALLRAKAPPAGQTVVDPGVTIDASALLPDARRFFRYVGSLTTPPCSEGVAWYVLEQPLRLAGPAIGALLGVLPAAEARPLQARNGRRLTLN